MAIVELDRKKRDLMLKRSDILQAAEHVFAVKGYHRATMLDIAEQAQYAVGTLYIYFKDKQNLYINLFEEKMKELLCLIEEKIDNTPDVFEKIKILIKTQLEFFVNNEDFFRIYFSERGGADWAIKDKLPASVFNLFAKFLDCMTRVIKKAQSKGIVKNDLHPQKVSYMLSAAINSIIIPWLRNSTKKKEDLLNQVPFILDVFLNGVGQRR